MTHPPEISRPQTRRRFAVIDRDGTLIEERGYLANPEGVTLLPGAVEGLRHLRRLGLGIVVATNQSGLARGYFDEAQLAAVHSRLCELLGDEGIALDGIYVCPHGPADNCRCRKPAPGLVEQAAEAHGFDPARVIVVGDKPADVDLGLGLGASSILVLTGYGASHAATVAGRAHAIVADLTAAAQWIEQNLDL